MVDRTVNVSGYPHTPFANRGVLTAAHGPARFIDLAKTLALSLELHSPHVPRAIVTDSDDPELIKLFDVIVEYRPEFGPGHFQKSVLDLYTPFNETFFIESDSLCTRDIDTLWALFQSVPFGVSGQRTELGHSVSIKPSTFQDLEFDSLPAVTGGLVYFRRGPDSDSIFQQCRKIMDHYEELPLDLVPTGATDEVAFSLAVAMHGLPAIDDNWASLAAPNGDQERLCIDVLGGKTNIVRDGKCIQPAVIHFSGKWINGSEYRRERLMLDLVVRKRWPKPIAALIAKGMSIVPAIPSEG